MLFTAGPLEKFKKMFLHYSLDIKIYPSVVKANYKLTKRKQSSDLYRPASEPREKMRNLMDGPEL